MSADTPPPSLIEFLQSHALFGGLDDAALALVIPLLKRERFEPGSVIVREGEPGDRMHFILLGCAEVLKAAAPDAPPALLGVLRAGDAFGEMGLIDVQARSASVRAQEPVETLSLTNRDLLRIHRSNPEVFTMIILNLARELSRRLRRMDEQAAMPR